jgi:hypothetical protein
MTRLARPLLFVDVDGPLNPYAAKPERRPEGYATHRMKPDSWVASNPHGRPRPAAYTRPLRVWLNPRHGSRLLELPCDLVWATAWAAEANQWIAPEIGLPALPVIQWPDPREPAEPGLHWKTGTILQWAGGRPFCWIDDELTPADQTWVAAHTSAETLLHRVDPRTGLTDEDFALLADWFAGVRANAS